MLLAKAKLWLSRNDFEKVIHAFISTRLDYCNSLYVGINKQSTSRLQMVQNSVARLLLGVRKREHITPILMSFNWLSVHFRIDFKIILIVFESLHALAPLYLSQPNEISPII